VCALLKPIVEVPKVVVALLALFELVEIAKAVIIIRVRCCVVTEVVVIVLLLKRYVGIRGRLGCTVTRIYGRPVMRGW
jgi:hypothetical protein